MNTCARCGNVGSGEACARCGAPFSSGDEHAGVGRAAATAAPTIGAARVTRAEADPGLWPSGPQTPTEAAPSRGAAGVATPARRKISPVVPVFAALMGMIAAVVLGGIFLLPRVLKSSSGGSDSGGGAVIPISSPSVTPTVTLTGTPSASASASGTPAASTTPPASPTPSETPSATPSETPSASPSVDPVLAADCEKAGAKSKQLATCADAWDFLKRYGPIDQGKTMQADDLANWWTNPASYYGTRYSHTKLLPKLTAPSKPGVSYGLGSLADFKDRVVVNGRRGVQVELDVPFTDNGQAGTVKVEYKLVPGEGGNKYRIASVREA